MPIGSHEQLGQHKAEIRKAAHAARKAQGDKETLSQKIVDTMMSLPAYQNAKCVLWYIDVRDEVRTRHALPAAISGDKRIVIPFCVDGDLELFHLQSLNELSEGMYGILEPKERLREMADKRVSVEELDLILVPGVGFDASGGRIGHGKGYYDTLLENARLETPLVSLAFECQTFDEIPMQSHDIYMDRVVTENTIYSGKGRLAV